MRMRKRGIPIPKTCKCASAVYQFPKHANAQARYNSFQNMQMRKRGIPISKTCKCAFACFGNWYTSLAHLHVLETVIPRLRICMFWKLVYRACAFACFGNWYASLAHSHVLEIGIIPRLLICMFWKLVYLAC